MSIGVQIVLDELGDARAGGRRRRRRRDDARRRAALQERLGGYLRLTLVGRDADARDGADARPPGRARRVRARHHRRVPRRAGPGRARRGRRGRRKAARPTRPTRCCRRRRSRAQARSDAGSAGCARAGSTSAPPRERRRPRQAPPALRRPRRARGRAEGERAARARGGRGRDARGVTTTRCPSRSSRTHVSARAARALVLRSELAAHGRRTCGRRAAPRRAPTRSCCPSSRLCAHYGVEPRQVPRGRRGGTRGS